MSSAPNAAEVARDSRWLLQALDPAAGLARLIAMDGEAYRAASFLDDRMLQQPRTAHVVPWAAVAQAAELAERDDARWIFHIGHVGSTLIARMLGELEAVLSVREPRVLRDLAMLQPQVRAAYLPAVRKLLSRSFGPGQSALVKATSFVSEIAPELAGPSGGALLLYAAPRAYIATILAGPNSMVELDHYAQSRRQRLAERGIALDGAEASPAHRAAEAWACEMTALEAAADAIGDDRSLWADFDAFLAEPAGQLEAIARFFGFEATGERIAAIASGPLLGRYSKAPEHDYSPGLRRELLGEAEQANRADIDAALAMLERSAENAPLLARALGRARRES
ncbi:MAG TPA: hypothetical protein VM346_05705 [Sphingomicrobium sp.]|nr:hypothetical protein [Sphingomicrobium sp.]